MIRTIQHFRSRSLRLPVLFAAALVTAVTIQATPAPAQDDTATQPTDVQDTALATYVADYGVSTEEARRRIARIDGLQELMEMVRQLEASRVAGWAIDHGTRFIAWVQLTGSEVPTPQATLIADAHDDLEIRTDASHSLTQLIEAQRQIMGLGATGRVDDTPSTAEPLDGLADMIAYSYVDMANNALTIGIDAARHGTSGAVGSVDGDQPTFAVAAAQADQLLAETLTVNYTLEDGTGFGTAANIMGGQELTIEDSVEDGTLYLCTSGFTATKRGTASYGIITAAHCIKNDADVLRVSSMTPRVILSLGPRQHGPYVDAMFYSIPAGHGHQALDDYQCDETDPCDVSHTVARGRMMSAPVCHYGTMTQETCGTVSSINFWPGNNASCASQCGNTFVKVTGPHLRVCEGDSGGPVYYGSTAGNKAYGILSGGSDVKDCASTGKFFYFSPIESVENHLRVDVLTLGSVSVN